jgi:acyl homoserine lactone synthase
VEFLGEPHRSEEGHKIVAGSVTVSRAALEKVRGKTGIREIVLNYGDEMEYRHAA